ncbi:MAG: hypothetical protein ACLQGV_11790 [Bryobacteraceae bacterium]
MGTKTLWCGGLMLAAVALAAEPIPCTLDVASEGTDVLLSVPSDGNVDVNLVCSSIKTTPGALELALSAFTGDEGSFGAVLLPAQAPAGAKPQQPLKVTVPKTLLVPLRLAAPSLPQSGKYTGRLLILAEGRDPVVRKIVLTREAERGTLIISPQPLNATIARPFWGGASGTTFSVALREKTGKLRLEGITARLESVSKAPEEGFTFQRNLGFAFNGTPVDDMERTPTSDSGRSTRAIPAGSQAVVGVTLQNLQAGEYNAVLRFQATNSNDDDAQKLTLTVQARDSWLRALIVLVAALVISFLTTKLLTSYKRRASLLMRIRETQAAGLASEPHSLPVVWARSVLRQTEELSRRFLLTSPDQIEARITGLQRPLELLGKTASLRNDLKLAGLHPWILRRAEAILDHIVSSIGAFSPDDGATAKIKEKLDELAQWLDPKKRDDCYWKDLRASTESLLDEADLGLVENAEAVAVMQGFQEDLQRALDTPPADLNGKFKAETTYDAFKILWERRTDPVELAAAVECWTQSNDIQALFRLANDRIWLRMHKAKAHHWLEIDMPHTDPANPAEAYDVLHFELKTSDPILDLAYLFQHRLEYHWHFKLKYWWHHCIPRVLELEPRSAEPRIVQYFPYPGKLTASVSTVYHMQCQPPADGTAPLLEVGTDVKSHIRESSDFAGYKKFHTAEVISWLLACALALVTGLTTFYFKGGAFGSVQDYLTLFAWGTSIDQARNIFQSAQAPSSPPAKAS